MRSDQSSPAKPKAPPPKPSNTPKKEKKDTKAQTPKKMIAPPAKKKSPEPPVKNSKSNSAGKKPENVAPIRQLRGRGVVSATNQPPSKFSKTPPKMPVAKWIYPGHLNWMRLPVLG